jgi:hypothetical protein
MISVQDGLAAAALSTPRIIARFQGKALHYGCAILIVAVAAPSLSQLMHILKTGTSPVAHTIVGRREGGGFRLGPGAAGL